LIHQNNSQNSIPKVMVIFPAKNEEGTIENSIATAKQSYYKPDVILVDTFSTDKTTQLAGRAAAIIIQQPTKNLSSKRIGSNFHIVYTICSDICWIGLQCIALHP
jgi:glycosyltransferase involved in cell wall biosynthesis